MASTKDIEQTASKPKKMGRPRSLVPFSVRKEIRRQKNQMYRTRVKTLLLDLRVYERWVALAERYDVTPRDLAGIFLDAAEAEDANFIDLHLAKTKSKRAASLRSKKTKEVKAATSKTQPDPDESSTRSSSRAVSPSLTTEDTSDQPDSDGSLGENSTESSANIIQDPNDKPKKKRGRPPKDRPVDFPETKPPPRKSKRVNKPLLFYGRIGDTAQTSSSGIDVRLVDGSDDAEELSPMVRSARQAFSMALAMSCGLTSSPKSALCAGRQSMSLEVPSEIVSSELDQDTPSQIPRRIFRGTPQESSEAYEPGVAANDAVVVMNNGVLKEDGGAESALNDFRTLFEEEEEMLNHAGVALQAEMEDNDEESYAMESDQSVDTRSYAQRESDEHTSYVNAHQLIAGGDSVASKVPDLSRRSRLNQITGGLMLSKLQTAKSQ